MKPVLCSFGSFQLYTYGAFVALALAAAFVAARVRAPKFGFVPDEVTDLLLILFATGVFGARLFYVMQHIADYLGDPLRAFSLREGGLIWYGGFIFASIAGFTYASWRGWPLLRLADFFAPIAALGHAIGRLGCFFNGCCYGREVSASLGIVFAGDNVPRLPVQLYEATALFAIAWALFGASQRRHREGLILVLYLLLYSAARFAIEFGRDDQTSFVNLTLPQWTSLVLFAGAALLYARLRRRPF